MAAADEVYVLTLDQLPYLCLVTIFEYLSAEDIGKFSRVCKSFYDASRTESLWRRHSLWRWAFCDINQIEGHESKWLRYYQARILVENKMDTGRPTRDYRVKSLRNHKGDIVNALCLNGTNINWEKIAPPLLLSLSNDSIVHAWNVLEGKPLWSVEDCPVISITGNEGMVAIGDSNGQVILYNAPDWSPSGTIKLEGPVVAMAITQFQSMTALITSIPSPTNSSEGLLTVWSLDPINVLSSLSSSIVCDSINITGEQWLAGTSEDDPMIMVWDLFNITNSPCDPHVTVHRSSVGPTLWASPGLLVTASTTHQTGLIPIPHPGLIPGPRRRRRYNPFAGTMTGQLEYWNISKHLKDSKIATSNVYQVSHVYDATKSIHLMSGVNVLQLANGHILTGDERGTLSVIDTSTGTVSQSFTHHTGPITDMHADNYRVLTCSKDFSIRVYRWKRCEGKPLQLESLYQLLGGSVAHKTHDGFSQVICSAGSCVGVAGNILKLYNFAASLS